MIPDCGAPQAGTESKRDHESPEPQNPYIARVLGGKDPASAVEQGEYRREHHAGQQCGHASEYPDTTEHES